MTLQKLAQLKKKVVSEHFMAEDREKTRITMGMGTCGIKAGAAEVLKELKREYEDSRDVFVTHTGCLGMCSHEPVMQVAVPGKPVVTYCHMTPEKARKAAGEYPVHR